MQKKKLLFLIIWVLVLSLGPLTVLKNTPFSYAVTEKRLLVNFFQRIIGLSAFTLLFYQILVGSFMQKWTEKVGAWIFRFHIMEGVLAYLLILLHPSLFVVYNYLTLHKLNPLYVFVDFCILCSKKIELYYSFGRFAFWLVNLTVVVGLFRTADPWLRRDWRKLHILNYPVFFLVWFHLTNVGTDGATAPFVYFSWAALAIVSVIVVFKIYKLFRS